jgi:hypothetical protein
VREGFSENTKICQFLIFKTSSVSVGGRFYYIQLDKTAKVSLNEQQRPSSV